MKLPDCNPQKSSHLYTLRLENLKSHHIFLYMHCLSPLFHNILTPHTYQFKPYFNIYFQSSCYCRVSIYLCIVLLVCLRLSTLSLPLFYAHIHSRSLYQTCHVLSRHIFIPHIPVHILNVPLFSIGQFDVPLWFHFLACSVAYHNLQITLRKKQWSSIITANKCLVLALKMRLKGFPYFFDFRNKIKT
jgi:hypothetical protein